MRDWEEPVSNHNEFPGGQDMAEEAARKAEEARARAHTTVSGAAREADRAVERMRGGGQMNERMNEGLRAAGTQLSGLARQLRERAPAGQGGEAAHSAASMLDRGAGYLQSADAETIRGDLEGWIRRNPLQALAVGVGLGFALGRALKR